MQRGGDMSKQRFQPKSKLLMANENASGRSNSTDATIDPVVS